MKIRTILAGAIALGVAASAHATTYTVVTVDASSATSLGLTASSINDNGQAAGFWVDGTPFDKVYHAYTVKADGTGFTSIDRPGYVATGASGINNAGVIVGVSVDPSFTATGFLRAPNGTYSTIDPNAGGLTSAYSEAVGINNLGDTVGYFDPTAPGAADPQVKAHGFLDQAGIFTQLDVPVAWGTGTEAYSINDFGVIAGGYLDTVGLPKGFIYIAGLGYSTPSVPGGAPFSLGAINDLGEVPVVVESYDPTSPTQRGYYSFLHTAAGDTPFSVPGAKYTNTYALNLKGQVSGFYIDPSNAIHGFIASPAPEPAAWAMMLLGFGLVGSVTRQRAAVTVPASARSSAVC